MKWRIEPERSKGVSGRLFACSLGTLVAKRHVEALVRLVGSRHRPDVHRECHERHCRPDLSIGELQIKLSQFATLKIADGNLKARVAGVSVCRGYSYAAVARANWLAAADPASAFGGVDARRERVHFVHRYPNGSEQRDAHSHFWARTCANCHGP
jgi:hypothetical protein